MSCTDVSGIPRIYATMTPHTGRNRHWLPLEITSGSRSCSSFSSDWLLLQQAGGAWSCWAKAVGGRSCRSPAFLLRPAPRGRISRSLAHASESWLRHRRVGMSWVSPWKPNGSRSPAASWMTCAGSCRAGESLGPLHTHLIAPPRDITATPSSGAAVHPWRGTSPYFAPSLFPSLYPPLPDANKR